MPPCSFSRHATVSVTIKLDLYFPAHIFLPDPNKCSTSRIEPTYDTARRVTLENTVPRNINRTNSTRTITAVVVLLLLNCMNTTVSAAASRPNILLAISDDQSYPYASAYGDKTTNTPVFDRIAREGILFTNAFCASPGCSPCRAALLTGRHTWQIEQAGTHASSFPKKYRVYPDILEDAGYFVGYTGKGWGPGNWKVSGRTRNPAGPVFSKHKAKVPRGISKTDYARNFQDFLERKPKDKPFCFWFGASEPHRAYAKGRGLTMGKKLEDAHVPPFLPDTPEIRSDILDYCAEIDHFDQHLGRMIHELEERGELDNTLILVTADNGMPFPRAKANGYEYGIHAPMAIRWPIVVKSGRTIDDLIGFVDYAPTFLEAAGLDVPSAMPGRSLMNILRSEKSGRIDPGREMVFSARERHSSSRWNNWTYPIRSMRTHDYLLIRNFRPNRWPAGDPAGFQGAPFGYYDIDGCPSKTFLIEHRKSQSFSKFFHWAIDKRPEFELFDVKNDPGNLNNLANDAKHAALLKNLQHKMENYLRNTGDPRVIDGGDIYEEYKRYSRIRQFPKPPIID